MAIDRVSGDDAFEELKKLSCFYTLCFFSDDHASRLACDSAGSKVGEWPTD
jgi:hypothetical protein